jgi:hypothetical protein
MWSGSPTCYEADSAEHRRAAALGDQQQRLGSGLPFRPMLNLFGEACNVAAGIAERYQRSAIGQGNRIFEAAGPTRRRHRANSSAPAGVKFT